MSSWLPCVVCKSNEATLIPVGESWRIVCQSCVDDLGIAVLDSSTLPAVSPGAAMVMAFTVSSRPPAVEDLPLESRCRAAP